MADVLVMAYATYVAFDVDLVVTRQAKPRFPIIFYVSCFCFAMLFDFSKFYVFLVQFGLMKSPPPPHALKKSNVCLYNIKYTCILHTHVNSNSPN